MLSVMQAVEAASAAQTFADVVELAHDDMRARR